jgi:hypothetical protein
MRAFSIYICDRSKHCLFHKDWTSSALDEAAAHNRFITLYGLIFQMKLFTSAADPTKPIGTTPGCKPDGMRPTAIGEGTGFRYETTVADFLVHFKSRDICRCIIALAKQFFYV